MLFYRNLLNDFDFDFDYYTSSHLRLLTTQDKNDLELHMQDLIKHPHDCLSTPQKMCQQRGIY